MERQQPEVWRRVPGRGACPPTGPGSGWSPRCMVRETWHTFHPQPSPHCGSVSCSFPLIEFCTAAVFWVYILVFKIFNCEGFEIRTMLKSSPKLSPIFSLFQLIWSPPTADLAAKSSLFTSLSLNVPRVCSLMLGSECVDSF